MEDSRRVMPSVCIPLLVTVIAIGPFHCQLLKGFLMSTRVFCHLPSMPKYTELVLRSTA